ncbi:MAG: UDP-N-acetylglucosamine--N-acetylmuramyl-(pentapeptide) pyrophosphoryl-undecaprenol N-acetylglucosamine transferase [Candidatus Doudnabacteria bacterium]|nr:UDP-N-acetylglucosamine--N-acetylmuramyl-(pentapeptide) pyrophosphoryl-undecaprenol N-acetylglucosamine transferase [Candidatus Doudnabacteria bacterium]
MSLKILVSGGGTGGSVSPILAVVEELYRLKPKAEILFVGTSRGPERQMVEQLSLPFIGIPPAKLRRYFSLRNFLDIFVFVYSLVRAWFVVRSFRPDVIFSVGSFVSVPVCWAGKLLGVRIVIHQQDVRIGLANKLIAPFADKITTAFAFTAKSFYSGSGLFTRKWRSPAEWVGNPVRSEIFEKNIPVPDYIKLTKDLPILLILGGATGSDQINRVIIEAASKLVRSFQIIHQTGKLKKAAKFSDPNYHVFELLPFDAYAYLLQKAHLVVARAGLSTITELSALGKAAVIVPMPESHQEDNAVILNFTSSAVVLNKQQFTPDNLVKTLTDLNFDPEKQKIMAQNISRLIPTLQVAEKLAKIVIKTGE